MLTIRPPPFSSMFGSTRLMSASAPKKLTCISRWNISIEKSSVNIVELCAVDMIALLTNTSIRPRSASAASAAASTEAVSSRSITANDADPPMASISERVCSRLPGNGSPSENESTDAPLATVRPPITTWKPAFANSMQIALPMPRVPPVTNAVRCAIVIPLGRDVTLPNSVSTPDQMSTAEAASRWRALQTLHLDPPAFVDDWAVHLLPDDERDALRGDAGRAEFLSNTSGWAMSGVGVGCLLFAEDVVLAAVASGVDQYVILGAGFDTFAMRHPELAGTLTTFEVDHPE